MNCSKCSMFIGSNSMVGRIITSLWLLKLNQSYTQQNMMSAFILGGDLPRTFFTSKFGAEFVLVKYFDI